MRGFALLLLMIVAKASCSAPFLEGSVSDEMGRPIAGATVRIWDCLGTCFGGDTRITDKDGRYRFDQPGFRNMPSLSVSMPGRYHVSTDYRGPALSKTDSAESRTADFVLGTPASVEVRVKGDPPAGWTQAILLRASRDAKLHRYDLTGEHVSGWNYWRIDLVPRSESYHVVVVRQPAIEFTSDKKELRDRKRESGKQKIELVSQAIHFVNPQKYSVQVTIEADHASHSPRLQLTSIKDALAQDRLAKLADDDPLYGPPVDAEARRLAIELLQRVETAARPWNARPSKSIHSFSYDAVDASGKRTPVTITQDSPVGPAWSDISRLRGFAYMPPLRWIFSQPENVTFHDVEIGEESATLVYRLKEGRGFAAGLGVGPGWNGFFSRSFSAGRLQIDLKNDTVKEHRFSSGATGEESVETFFDYVKVSDGYAPQSMRIESKKFDFHLRFKVHGDLLWLLDTASRGESESMAMRIENVSVKRSNQDVSR